MQHAEKQPESQQSLTTPHSSKGSDTDLSGSIYVTATAAGSSNRTETCPSIAKEDEPE
jgi:hypothetical protein